jgi:hypothetical protein
MRLFLWGVLTMATAVAALFFLRYFRRTGDRLFGFFAFSFALMSANWASHVWITPAQAPYAFRIYLVRLLAFALIVVGIIDKNRRSARVSEQR